MLSGPQFFSIWSHMVGSLLLMWSENIFVQIEQNWKFCHLSVESQYGTKLPSLLKRRINNLNQNKMKIYRVDTHRLLNNMEKLWNLTNNEKTRSCAYVTTSPYGKKGSVSFSLCLRVAHLQMPEWLNDSLFAQEVKYAKSNHWSIWFYFNSFVHLLRKPPLYVTLSRMIYDWIIYEAISWL